MSTPDADEKARNRKIAENEQHRKAISAVRVSSWAIFIAFAIGAIVVGIFWAWTHR
jgi:uncharacterized membrane protein YukC